MTRLAVILAGLLLAAAAPAVAQEFTGNAVALASDHLEVDGEQFYLFGIDGLEPEQTCFINGALWSCGPVAHRELEILVDEGPATCVRREDPDQGRGQTNWATCTIGETDLAEAMVRAGFAFVIRDQSEDYLAAQDAAEAAGAGAWQGIFIVPWEFRDRLRGL